MKYPIPPHALHGRPLAALLLAISFLSSSASALVMREEGPEPIIVQVKESFRLSDDLDSHFREVESSQRRNGLQVVKRWAGSKLLVLLSFPSNFTREQALAAIGRLEQLPAVEKVVPVSAFNLHFRSGDFKREYTPNQTIPDVARRGLDADRMDRPPARGWSQRSLSQTPHVPNRLIVRWKEERIWRADSTGFDEVIADLHRETGCRVLRETRYSPVKLTQVLEFDDPNTLADKIRRYIESGLVVYAQPDFIYKTLAAPDDPWYLNYPGPQWTLPIISAEPAWSMTTGNPSVIIAVADSGANVVHPDFDDNLWSGQNSGYHHNFIDNTDNVDDDFDPEYHGSAVASIIGAEGGNQLGMTGIAQDTSLMILKVVNSAGQSSTKTVAEAIDYAADQGATAINLSVGFYDANCDEIEPNVWQCFEGEYDEALQDALVNARKSNMVVVSAAGNGGSYVFPDPDLDPPVDNDFNINRLSPASIPTDNNISVMATRQNDTRASHSSYGKYRVDLAAPGGQGLEDVPAYRQLFSPTFRNGITGTSAAAPHVAGAIALIKSHYPWENYLGLRDRVLMSTDSIPGATQGVEGKCRTNGRLNLYKALQPRSMLKNLSTRARVEGGDKVMIAGFIIGGSASGGPIEVAMRGIGPSLDGTPGITDPLGDPVIELHGPNGLFVENDNWEDDPSKAELAANGLAPSDSTEAAMIRELDPGEYTVILRTATGSQSDFGVGLVELYALGDSEESRFKNISTRCLVGTGENVAIAGTIIDSSGFTPLAKPDRRLLIFGKGPSLQLLGMAPSGFLSNPYLEIPGVVSNDNWLTLDDDSGDGSALDEKLIEADFAPTHTSESALWHTFRPGGHTVILSGINQSTGIGLIEFYEY